MTELCFVADMNHGNPVNFARLAAASFGDIKCVGIIHKASQGRGYTDPKYAQRRPDAIAAGFLWGAYAFNTGDDVKAQVTEFLEHACPEAETGLYLDFEDNSASEMTLGQAVEFLDRVEQIMGRYCRMYSGNRLKEQIVHATPAQVAYLAAYQDRLWGCEYGPLFKDVDAKGHRLPWPKPFLWQDTGDGLGPQPHTLDGIENGADLSIFEGTRAELAAIWAGAALPPAVVAGPQPQAPARVDQALAPPPHKLTLVERLEEGVKETIEHVLGES
jgi:lysozyme